MDEHEVELLPDQDVYARSTVMGVGPSAPEIFRGLADPARTNPAGENTVSPTRHPPSNCTSQGRCLQFRGGYSPSDAAVRKGLIAIVDQAGSGCTRPLPDQQLLLFPTPAEG